jgi:hypothetical protein
MSAIAVASKPTIRQRLRPYQVEVARAILDSVFNQRALTISVEIARQGGKNELSAQLEMFLLIANMLRAADLVKCAPTFEPQCRISMSRLWARLGECGLASISARQSGRAIRVGQARQLFLSAEPGSNVVGHTAHVLLEVDEAQDVERDKFDKEFRPMAASTAATTVLYGTAWDDRNLLEQTKQTNLEAERRDGVRRHFEYDWEAVARYNPAYAAYVEAERQRLGDDHPLFLSQYCLRTVGGGGRLFRRQQCAQLQGDHARQSQPLVGDTYVAGLDLAGQSLELGAPPTPHRDATVLTIARVRHPPRDALVQEPRLDVVEHYAWVDEPHERLFERLVDVLGPVWRVRRLAVDATGLGETMARLLLSALGRDVVQPFRFTAESKSRLGYNLLAAVNGGRLKTYAADGSDEYRCLFEQVERARVAYRPNRTMNFFVDPAEGHDDYLMSLALAVEAAAASRPRTARGRIREEGA